MRITRTKRASSGPSAGRAKAADGTYTKVAGGRAARVGRNTLSLYATINLTSLLSFFITILLTRELGVEAFGQYSLLVSWVAILGSFSDLGLNTLTIRDVARRKELTIPYLTQVMTLRFVFSSVFYLVLVSLGFILGYEPLLRVGLAVLGGRLIIDATGGAYAYLLQAHERMGRQGLFMLASTAVRLAGVFAVLSAGGDVLAVSGVWVAVSFLTLIAMALDAAWRGWIPRFGDWRAADSFRILKTAFPFAIVGALQMMYYRADSILLKSLAGNSPVGLYNAAGSILQYVFLMAQLFSLALLPVLSSASDPRVFARVLVRSIKAVWFLAIPITVGGILLARPIVVLLFQGDYAPSAPVLSVLLLSAIPFFLTTLTVNVLAIKRPTSLVILYASLLALNGALNLLWIPAWGVVGSAAAKVVCEMCGVGMGFFFIRGFLATAKVRVIWPLTASVFSAVLMGLLIGLDPRLYWLLLGPGVYFTGLWFLKALGPEDWASLRSVFRMKNGPAARAAGQGRIP